jgi:mRNA interferase MazF
MDLVMINQYEIYWINLDPTRGSEMSKTRPCVVISPVEMNEFLRTIIIIPVTSSIKNYPWRVKCRISNKNGSIATDQIKTVDRSRLLSKIGNLTDAEVVSLKKILRDMLIN